MGRIHQDPELVPLGWKRRQALFALAVAALTAGALVVGSLIAEAGADAPPASVLPHFDYAGSDLTVPEARGFGEFPLYFVGTDFDGLPLTAIHRRSPDYESAAPGRLNYVSFKYGSCTPSGDTGCSLPLEIQVWPACERNASSRTLVPDLDGPGPAGAVPYPRERATVRGAPAAVFDRGGSVEVYSGDVTIVLWGDSRQRLLAAAGALRSVDSGVMPNEALPRPVAAAARDRRACRT